MKYRPPRKRIYTAIGVGQLHETVLSLLFLTLNVTMMSSLLALPFITWRRNVTWQWYHPQMVAYLTAFPNAGDLTCWQTFDPYVSVCSLFLFSKWVSFIFYTREVSRVLLHTAAFIYIYMGYMIQLDRFVLCVNSVFADGSQREF
jgi:hypothetical protein